MLAAELTLYCEYFCLSVATEILYPECCGLFKLNVISSTSAPMCLQAHPFFIHHVFPSLLILSVFLNQFCRKSSVLFITVHNTPLNQFLSSTKASTHM